MSPRSAENAGLWDDNTEVYVKKWIDYTNKYGIGYKLSNEGFGVYFNDNTKIVLMPDMESVFYVQKFQGQQESQELYSIQQYPAELKKKVVLLLHFKNYMDNNSFKGKIPLAKPLLAQ
jgi:polo-like kinase 1